MTSEHVCISETRMIQHNLLWGVETMFHVDWYHIIKCVLWYRMDIAVLDNYSTWNIVIVLKTLYVKVFLLLNKYSQK